MTYKWKPITTVPLELEKWVEVIVCSIVDGKVEDIGIGQFVPYGEFDDLPEHETLKGWSFLQHGDNLAECWSTTHWLPKE